MNRKDKHETHEVAMEKVAILQKLNSYPLEVLKRIDHLLMVDAIERQKSKDNSD